MSITIPRTQDLVTQFRAYIEARLNQTTPVADRAYNTVLATDMAMSFTALFKYAVDRDLANLAQTAIGADLDKLGLEYGLTRNQAVAWVGTITITGTNSTVIPAGWIFIATGTNALYTNNAIGTIAVGTVTLTLTAQVAGSAGNLSNGATLSMQSQIAGATGVPTVASTVTTGTDAETDSAYRVRVLAVQQAVNTGSNGAAYRIWAEGVAGVINAYPYAGPPAGSGITSEPPMRTVYVECNTSIQSDGIAPAGLLTQVTTAITTNPVTGLSNQDLGLTAGTLYVVAITRTPIYVQISSLNVPSGQTAQCQAAISAALTTYFLSITPFVTGVDPAFNRNDTITNPSVSKIIQGVLTAYGASAANIAFGLTASTFNSSYTVGEGEKTKLSAVSYI